MSIKNAAKEQSRYLEYKSRVAFGNETALPYRDSTRGVNLVTVVTVKNCRRVFVPVRAAKLRHRAEHAMTHRRDSAFLFDF